MEKENKNEEEEEEKKKKKEEEEENSLVPSVSRTQTSFFPNPFHDLHPIQTAPSSTPAPTPPDLPLSCASPKNNPSVSIKNFICQQSVPGGIQHVWQSNGDIVI